MKTAFFPLLFVIILSTTTLAQIVPDYYPLKVGYSWEYKLGGSSECHKKKTVINYNEELNTYSVRSMTFMGDLAPFVSGENAFEPRDNKILHTGNTNAFGGTKILNNCIILQYPLEISSTWESGDEENSSTYKVLAFCNLKVEAGEFKNVCKIQKVIKCRDSNSGKMKVIATSCEYYAPNIGLIKEECVSKDKSVTPILELVRYNCQ